MGKQRANDGNIERDDCPPSSTPPDNIMLILWTQNCIESERMNEGGGWERSTSSVNGMARAVIFFVAI